MEDTKEVLIPEKREEQVVGYTCDLCGAKCGRNKNWENGPSPEYAGTMQEVTIRYRWGHADCGGGSGQIIEADICPRCFVERIIPALRGDGLELWRREWDW